MNAFLTRISSRKFLTVLAVEIAAVVAIFQPGMADTVEGSAVAIAGLIVLLLAALGYGAIEASVDKSEAKRQ